MPNFKYGFVKSLDCFAFVLFSLIYICIFENSLSKDFRIFFCCLFFIILYFWSYKKDSSIIFKCCFCTMCVVQLFCGYFLMVEYSTWDVYAVTQSATALVDGSYFNSGYFAKYPNNTAIMLFFALVFKITSTIFHSNSIYFLVILNIIAIDISIIFALKIMKLLFSKNLAYRTGIICCFFSPYYLYVPICYTDTFSMPFIMIILYNILKITHLKYSLTKTTAIFLVIGILSYIGFKIKGSVIIVLIAIFMYLFVKLHFKQFLISSFCILLGFLFTNCIWIVSLNTSNLISKEQYYQYQMPPSHWIMMGLRGVGNYNADDVAFTSSFPTYDQKNDADLAVIKERLHDFGLVGFINHAFQKATQYTWNYGTCYAERYLGDFGDPPILKNIMHEFILTSGSYHNIFYIITQSIYLLIFGFAIFSYLYSIVYNQTDFFLLRVSLLGFLLFFILWETHPRYILHFTLIMILLASVQLDKLSIKFFHCYSDFKHKERPNKI